MVGVIRTISRPGRGAEKGHLSPARHLSVVEGDKLSPLRRSLETSGRSSALEASFVRSPRRRSGGRGGPLRVALRQRSHDSPKGTAGRRACGAQARAPTPKSEQLAPVPGRVSPDPGTPEVPKRPRQNPTGSRRPPERASPAPETPVTPEPPMSKPADRFHHGVRRREWDAPRPPSASPDTPAAGARRGSCPPASRAARSSRAGGPHSGSRAAPAPSARARCPPSSGPRGARGRS